MPWLDKIEIIQIDALHKKAFNCSWSIILTVLAACLVESILENDLTGDCSRVLLGIAGGGIWQWRR